jgi:hypothetical protein
MERRFARARVRAAAIALPAAAAAVMQAAAHCKYKTNHKASS